MTIIQDKISALVLVGCIVTLASGCASLPSTQDPVPTTVEEAEEVGQLADVGKMDFLAAINLVNTIMQVPRLHPGALDVVKMLQPDRRFGRHVSEVMTAAGYNIEYVDRRDDDGSFLTHSRALGPIMSSYKIGIGDFKIRRSYTVEEDLVLPASSIFVFGADPDSIEINDDIFERGSSPQDFGVTAAENGL